jgi:hypothetical protein
MWNVVEQIWEVPQGQFTFHVGSSSRQLPLVSSCARSTSNDCADNHLVSDYHSLVLSGEKRGGCSNKTKLGATTAAKYNICHNIPLIVSKNNACYTFENLVWIARMT